MRVRTVRVGFFLATVLVSQMLCAADREESPARPAFLAPRSFSWQTLAEPENLFWPGYFWYWNGPLEPDVLRRQLADMAAHDARSVCVVPMPHEFRPVATNNLMDVDYLSPQFFERVKVAVDEAARLKMNYWLYDEGGWPSGQAAGRVCRARPDLASHYLSRNAQGKWEANDGHPRDLAPVDVLNPQATETFIDLTHRRYADAVGNHFGKTIRLCFTNEPAYRAVVPGRAVPWTNGAEELFRRRFGYDALSSLDALGVADLRRLSPNQKKVRADFFDFWSQRFRDAYFLLLRDWSRRHGLASGGHLGGEDKTINAVTCGFGHVMRPLRAMDVPGVDVIWRQLWPGQANHHFPKFASSAAHQDGGALVMTESFGVYGDGLTPAQMKWLIDYQYVRGATLLVGCKYPQCTRDHLMTDERPNYGPANPLWDFLPEFHRYVARLSYVLACGQPAIDVALYYPVRDMWANGDPADPAVRGHDLLAQSLLSHQCDFDIIDDDALADSSTRADDGRLVVGAMRYRTIIVGPTRWVSQPASQRLRDFEAAGGRMIRVDRLDRIDAAVAGIRPTMTFVPRSPGLRVAARRWPGGGAAFIVNEGHETYRGTASIKSPGELRGIDPVTGRARSVPVEKPPRSVPVEKPPRSVPVEKPPRAEAAAIPLCLAPGESLLLVEGSREASAPVAPPPARRVVQSVDLPDGWAARVDRRYVAGEHEYEVRRPANAPFKPATLGSWTAKAGLDADFSGHVTYRRTVRVPESFRGGRVFLDLGDVEYAARVSLDGRKIGCVLWRPWRIELPALECPGEHLLEIEVSNTLANELTSRRVCEAWAKRKGPGWPSPYHQRALNFEHDSRGGGLLGPVRLELVAP